ncbi:hypothetical protein V5F49_18285 [Xanthobacter sp. V3C-3]|uniref:hypothetical protein n=1 Tax=Xanthobacter lutulentifluminis TaxID=3119935 RepID=UPI00372832BD
MRSHLLSRAGLLALAACAGVALGAPARAADRYMATGLPFFDPYRIAIATLDVNGGKVTGTLVPPVGDPRPALPLSGTLANGVLKLTVGQGGETYSLAFSENERGLHRIFEETASVPGLDAVSLFRPQAGFSGPALALQHDADNWCGLVYGGLTVELRAKDLAATADAPAALADLDLIVVPQQGGTTKVKLKDAWSRLRLAARSGDDVSVDVAVPVGAEARIAEELRRLPQVSAVMLPSLCGEMALAVVPRARLADGDKVSEAKLKGYAETVLSRLLSGAAPDAGAPGPRKFRLSGQVVPGDSGPVYRATVTGEAEATRLGKGSFDQFTLTLQPVVTPTDAADTISLIPAVSELKGAKKSGPQPPADAAFKPTDDSAQVAGITQRLVSYIAAAEGTRCGFLTQASFDEPEDSLSCLNIAIDDPSHADEN